MAVTSSKPPPLIGWGTIALAVAAFIADATWNHGQGLTALVALIRSLRSGS